MKTLPEKHVKRIAFAAFVLVVAGLGLLYQSAKALDGSGTNTVSPTSATAGSTGNTLAFTFTAGETMNSGAVTIAAPSGWTAPQSVNGTAGYTTVASTGMIANVEDAGDVITGWSAGNACSTGIDAFTTTKHEGTASIRCRNGNESNNDRWYKGITTENWSGYTKVGFWIYSSANIVSGDLRFAYDDTAAIASPIEQISFGSTITANTWTYVVLTFGATTRTSVVSYGFVIRSTSALDSVTVYVDDILLGPGSPTFPGGGIVRANLLQLASTQTVTVNYGAGGGASGAVAPTATGISTFTTQSRISDSGTLSPITSSPSVTVNPAATSQFTLNDPGNMTAGSRLGYVVTRKDQYGNAVTSGSNTVYLYSNSTDAPAFYTAASGGSPVTSIAIGAGTSTAQIWYYDTKAATATVTVSDNSSAPDGTTGIDDATDSVTVSASTTSQFSLNNPGDMTAGNRLGYVVTRKDAYNNVVTTGAQTVYLYSDSTGNKAFYNAASGGSLITSLSIGAGTSTGQFWYYDDKAGPVTVTASDSTPTPDGATGIADATDAVTVSAAAISKFALNNPGDMIVGSRLGYVVTRQDAFGNIVTSGSQTVYLYSNSANSPAFYTASSGGSPVTSISIGAGTSTAQYWYYDELAGSATTTASDNASAPDGDAGIDDATDSFSATVGPVAAFFLTNPGDMTAGTRLGYVVTRKDAYGNIVTSGSQTVYLYSNSTGNKAFYTASSGGSPVTYITIGAGTSTAQFWYYDDKVASVTVTASDNASMPDGATGLIDATDGVAISAAAVSQFTLSDPGDMVSGSRIGYVVTRKDAFGNIVTSGSQTVYLYSDSTGNKAFYAASSGGSPITSVSIGAGTSTKEFWYYDDKVASVTVTASDSTPTPDGLTGIDDATDTIAVTIGPVDAFFLNNPGDMTAGNRLGYVVTRKDAYGNLVTSGAQTVYLYSDSTGNKAFYDVASGGSPTASITIADGTSTASFWYYDDKVGSVTVTASDSTPNADGTTGIDDATDAVAVSAAFTSLFLLDNPGDMTAGTRLGYTVTRKDEFGNAVTTGSQTVYLYSDSTGNKAFYAASSGGSPITSVSIGAGTSTKTFWYYDNKVGFVTVTASDSTPSPDGTTGIDDATDDVTVNAAATSIFTLNNPGNMTAGTRLGYSVSREDAFGNLVTSGSQTVYLYSDSTNSPAFYTASSGGSPVTSISISAGTSTGEFWYYDEKADSVTVTASDSTPTPNGATGIDDATDAVTISAAATSQFTLNNPGDMTAGTRLEYVVTREDIFGNIVTSGVQTVYLSSDSTGNKAFYNVASGGSPVAFITIGDSTSTSHFWYYDDKAGSATVTSGADGIDNATDAVAVSAAATAQFSINDPGNMPAGTRLGYVVTRKDAFGNIVTSGSQTVYLYSDSTGNKAFYTGAPGGSPVTSVSIGAGTSTKEFWYYDDKMASVTITASDSTPTPDGATGIDDATDSVTISQGPAAEFTLDNPGDLVAGERVGYTVTRKDQFGNLVSAGSQNVYLYSDSTGSKAFYTASSGGSPVGFITIADGASTAQFWYYDDKVGSVTVTASDSTPTADGATGIDDASDSVAVRAASASQFLLSNPGDMTAGERLGYTVTRKDQFGNSVTTGTQTVYLYSNSLGNDAFYNVSSGGSPVAFVTIGSGTSSGAFWYYDDLVGSITISVSDNTSAPDATDGIDDATDAVSISPGSIAKFLLNDPGDMTVDTRVGYTVSRTDAYGNIVTSGSQTVYLYSSTTGTALFYTAASGGSPVTSVSIGDGTSTAHFWYNDNNIGTATVTVSDHSSSPDGDVGIDDASDVVHVIAIIPTKFVIIDPMDSVVGSSTIVIVQAQDAFGNVATRYTDDVTLNVSGSSTGGGLVDIVNGIGTMTLNDFVAETVHLTLSDTQTTGLEYSSSQDVVFQAGPTRTLTMNEPSDVVAGSRVGYNVTRKDQYGNPVTIGSETMYLYSDSTGLNKAFYGAAVDGGQITSVTFGTGDSTMNFWYQDESAGTYTISVSDNATSPDGVVGVDDAEDTLTIFAGATAEFLVNDPGSLVAGARIGYEVTRKDSYGNLVTTGTQSVYLYTDSSGHGEFFPTEVDGSHVSSVSIPTGSSTARFWYSDDRAASVTISVSDNSSSPDGSNGINDMTDAVTVQPAATSQFILNNPGDITVGTRAAYTVTRKDAYGNLVTSGSDAVHLYSNSSGTSTAFYNADPGGSTITSLVIGAGRSSENFWYFDNGEGSWTISASDSASAPDGTTGIDDGVDMIQVTAIPIVATKFVIIDPTDGTVGDTITVTVKAVDDFGSVQTTYQTDVTLVTSGDASGGGVVNIVDGVGTASIRDTVAQSVHLSLSNTEGSTLHVDSSQDLVFQPGPVSQFILNDPGDFTAGQRKEYTVTRKDSYGNLVTAGGNTVYLYTTSAALHGEFYDVASGGTAISSVSISGGTSAVSFWYVDDQTGVFTVSASDDNSAPDGTTGIDDATDSVLVHPAAVSQYTLSDPGDMTESTRVGYTVTRKDAYGNLVTDGTATVYLYTNSSGTSTAFYNAASAGSVITTVTIGAGQSSAQFWYTDNGLGIWTISASDNSSSADGATGIDDGTDAIQVNANAISATRFIILDPSDVLVGGTTVVTVRAVDASGNIDTSYQSDVTLVASGSATGDGLVSITDGVGTKTIRDMVAETVHLTLSDTEGTGLNVGSSQYVIFSSVAAPTAGGGGGSTPAPILAAEVPTILRVTGFAYPGARVVLRATKAGAEVDLAQIAVTAKNGSFVVEYTGSVDKITAYRAVVIDEQGLVAFASIFAEKPASGMTTSKSVTFAPTTNLLQRSVLQGASLGIVGHAVPGSSVVIVLDNGISYDPIPVREDGSYRVNVNTLRLSKGLHRVAVREVSSNGEIMGTSAALQFTVSQQINPKTDMNGDGVVDITDWSIFMSKWQSTDPAVRGTLDINGDGIVDVTDFSIFVQSIRK